MIFSMAQDIQRKKRVAGSRDSVGLSLFHLTHLLKAGVGLDDALSEMLALESSRHMRIVWADVATHVRMGKSLSVAFTSWPRVFDSVVVALIRAGEANGELAEACQSASELLEWQRTTRAQIVTVLLYPIFALLVMAGVVVFLFTAVVPSLEVFLQSSLNGLAWHTRSLLGLSEWLSRYYFPLLSSSALLVLAVAMTRQYSLAFKTATDRQLLAVPVLGSLLIGLSLGRYATISGRLYRSGVELAQSLAISEALISNLALRQQLSEARLSMLAGSTLGVALKIATDVPSVFGRLLAAGESAGALSQALQQAGEQFERHAQSQVARAERLIGPMTLLFVGGNLLWIIISVLAPVYELAIDAVLQS